MNSPGSASRAPAAQRALHGMAQHHRRTVAGDLDHVLGGVRARALRRSDDHLVDGVALASSSSASCACQGAMPRRAERRMRFGDARGHRAPERRTIPRPPRPGRRGNGDDGVVAGSRTASGGPRDPRPRPPRPPRPSPSPRRPPRPSPDAAVAATARRCETRGGSGRLAMPAGTPPPGGRGPEPQAFAAHGRSHCAARDGSRGARGCSSGLKRNGSPVRFTFSAAVTALRRSSSIRSRR